MRKSYHHGNLRAELIRCGREILERDGIQNLSLRAVTRAAGVSHGAPRNEFPDLNSLLAAIAAEGFEELIALRQAAMSRHRAPTRRLVAVLSCYIEFAAGRPDLFWLMYGPHIQDRQEQNVLIDASRRSYGVLEQAVVAYLDAMGLAGARNQELVQCTWSTVHGMAMLFNGRPLGPNIPTAMPFDRWKDTVIEFAIAGLQQRAALSARLPTRNA